MTAAGWALQKAIYDALRADPALKALIGDPPRVYDCPPERAVFPFVVFGDARESRIPGTDGLIEHDLRISVHSRYEGRREVEDILAALLDLLEDAALDLDGWRLVSLASVSLDITRRADTDAHHGLLRLRAVTERE